MIMDDYAKLPLFTGSSLEEITPYIGGCELIYCKKNDIILNGSYFTSKACFFILSGTVRIVKANQTPDVSYYDLEYPYGFSLENAFMNTCFEQPEEPCHLYASAMNEVKSIKIPQEQMIAVLKNQKFLRNFTQYLLFIERGITAPMAHDPHLYRKQKIS